MEEPDIFPLVSMFSESLPHFTDGRIDYHAASAAPVLSVIVRYQEEVLLLKRSDHVHYYKGKWNVVAGYLDELIPLKEKVLMELQEELGLTMAVIRSMHYASPQIVADKEVGVVWTIFPVLVELSEKPLLQLNEEHTASRWISPSTIGGFSTVPHLNKTLAAFL